MNNVSHIVLFQKHNDLFFMKHCCNLAEQSDETQKQPPEVFIKKLFLKILQYSQEDTCIGISF